jgi:hypothetical protein
VIRNFDIRNLVPVPKHRHYHKNGSGRFPFLQQTARKDLFLQSTHPSFCIYSITVSDRNRLGTDPDPIFMSIQIRDPAPSFTHDGKLEEEKKI